jgi:cell division protein FtsB
VAATLLFLVWIIFFDENSIVAHQQNKHRLYELKQQEKYYRKMINVDREKLEDIKEGEEKLEKFAREQYYMAKPGEEVFIVVGND